MIESEEYLGRPIYSLQTMLRRISEANPAVLPLIPDGIYGPNTYASVRSFQRTYGLTPTGITDYLTWQTIINTYTPLALIPPDTGIPVNLRIEPGEAHIQVQIAQAVLASLSDLFPELIRPPITGVLEPLTETALKWLQSAAGREQTGILDFETVNLLNHLYQGFVR